MNTLVFLLKTLWSSGPGAVRQSLALNGRECERLCDCSEYSHNRPRMSWPNGQNAGPQGVAISGTVTKV